MIYPYKTVFDDVYRRLIVRKKLATLIAHSLAPQVQTQINGIKFQDNDILVFPTWWPLPIAPMRPKNCTKPKGTRSIGKEVNFRGAEPLLF